MRKKNLTAGFMPLVDAAPLIVARSLGFAEEEGLNLTLRKAPSWSTLRDMLGFGQVAAAHMLAPVPLAPALGLPGAGPEMDVLSVLSVNGTVIGISEVLAERLGTDGHQFDFADAATAGKAVLSGPKPLRIGVPFRFSMHAELLDFWLRACGADPQSAYSVQTVPPPLMAQAIQSDEIDVFCVGEPWGSQAVETAGATLLLPGSAIWSLAPEKVLAVRRGWADADPDLTGRLMRAIWRAGAWLNNPRSWTMAAEILSAPEHLDLPAEIIDRALLGRLVITQKGETRDAPAFLRMSADTSFPWISQASWMGTRMARRFGLPKGQDLTAAIRVFRSDLYRQHLGPTGAALPIASAKMEGANPEERQVASSQGELILPANRFFNDEIFDPAPENRP